MANASIVSEVTSATADFSHALLMAVNSGDELAMDLQGLSKLVHLVSRSDALDEDTRLAIGSIGESLIGMRDQAAELAETLGALLEENRKH